MTIHNDNTDAFESELDRTLNGLSPAIAFEDRLIDRFRESTRRFRPFSLPDVDPLVLKSAMAVAATIAVAAIGFVGVEAMEPHGASALSGRAFESGNAPQIVPTEAVQEYRKVAQTNWAFDAGSFETPRSTNQEPMSAEGKDTNRLSETVVNKALYQSSAGEPGLVANGTIQAANSPSLGDHFGKALGKQVQFFEKAKLGYAFNTDARPQLGRKAAETESVAVGQLPKLSAESDVTRDIAGVPIVASPAQMVAQQPSPDPAVQPTSSPANVVADARKIIRTGNVEFEVASFDSTFMTLSKIVAEEAGIIGSTESTKLENGKTRGTVVVRVPPENLDRLVMKLRGLGELKTQNISAQDVTKQYTDLESQLRAAHAMQDRLLDMIKNGNGAIKDLLAAEKELGNWRTKIEQLEGERRFIESQVSLSTLSITLTEKDIAQVATVTRTENVNAGIECDDVETSRAETLAKIDELGGRVLSADLKQLDAGQFNSTIVAEIAPEKSGQLIDRLKQMGRVARLTAERSEAAADGSTTASPPKVETKPSTFQISLYNLANIAPRTTQTITLASSDVEAAYRGMIEESKKLAGKVVAGEMSHPRPGVVSASMRIDVPTSSADALAARLRSLGIIVSSSDSQSTDNTNVTSAKRGFSLTIIDVTTVPPRENVNVTVRVDSTGNALTTLLASVQQSGGKVISQNVSRDASGSENASVRIEVPGSASPTILQSLQSLGKVDAIQSSQNPDVPAGELARARYDVQFATTDAIAPKDGFWNSVRNGISFSLRGLGYSLQLITVGVCLVAPWVTLVWLGVKIRRRMKSPTTPKVV